MKPVIELLRSSLLADFPSGSSINYYQDKLYLVGDDANNLLILDTNYKRIDTIRLFDYPVKRIPKNQKADLETSTFITLKGVTYLLVLGSASLENRKKVISIPIINSVPDINQSLLCDLYSNAFFKQLRSMGIEEVNIEGATVIGDQLVLSNRGNISKPHNHLIITKADSLSTLGEMSFSTARLVLPVNTKHFAGVSELCYVEAKNMLLLTLSSEATTNAYDDGAIGDSYVGCIYNIAEKIHQPELKLDEMHSLPPINKEFQNEKIEGICVESVNGNELLCHLISDNDRGESKLFKIKYIADGAGRK
ncbi:hypothetical protein FAM09_27485 [Niastella caeni]|uniref:Uncharacterized protein n=1 Tax=Niastella caeni TaxID=2569763 RepID=A0A4V4GZG4_9BACT|nr:hypothetical protein [Niastella caeni]THU32536.1 hypothetical protein FAM09_27485 [Niastella caeni]